MSKSIEITGASKSQFHVFTAATLESAAMGHELNTLWNHNAHGFHTTCKKCGKVAGVCVTKPKARRGDAFTDPCRPLTDVIPLLQRLR